MTTTLKTTLMRFSGGSLGVVAHGKKTSDQIVGWNNIPDERAAEEIERLVKYSPFMRDALAAVVEHFDLDDMSGFTEEQRMAIDAARTVLAGVR